MFSPEVNTILIFVLMLAGIFMGYQLSLVLAGIGLLYGVFLFGPNYINTLIMGFLNVMQNYVLLAIPLFVLMGNIMQEIGAGKRIFDSLYVLAGRLRGGLAIATNLLATIFAACTGVVGASVVTVGTLGLPAMLSRNYDKKMASGLICAGGCLGVLIPPSIMIVVYGPIAGIPVGQLFMSVLPAGLLLSFTYTLYILARCYINPKMGPPITDEKRKEAFEKIGVFGLVSSFLIPVLIILAVLGSIFFGVAAPTEAAAVGVVASMVLGICYKELSWEKLKNSLSSTLTTTSMILTMSVGAILFISTFTSMGGIDVVKNFILALPFGKWGIFLLMCIVVIFLGMLLDWIGIVYLVVPLYTPIAIELGFNPVWFATIIILLLQLSYLTPPFALSIFYFKGIAPPDLTTRDLYSAVLPYIGLQVLAISFCILVPQFVLWLPGLM